MGDETRSAFSLRYGCGRSQERRGRPRVAARIGPGRIREPGYEPLAGAGRSDEEFNDPLLQGTPARTGTKRGIQASAAQNAAEQKSAASVLLGCFHSVRGMGQSKLDHPT